MMTKTGEDWRPDFEVAMGQSFGDYVCPPIPFDDASPHECCEAVWRLLGRSVTPRKLAALTEDQIATLGRTFGEYFETDPPTTDQMKAAIAQTLFRWPVGSLGD